MAADSSGSPNDPVAELVEREQELLATIHAHVGHFRDGAQQVYAGAGAMRAVAEAQHRRAVADEADRRELERRSSAENHRDQLQRLSHLIVDRPEFTAGHLASAPWDDPAWETVPTTDPGQVSLVRLGQLTVEGLGADPLPLAVPYIDSGNLVLTCTDRQRPEAVKIISNTLLRLLATLPPACFEFDVYDPQHLGQSLAQFHHLRTSESKVAKASMQQPEQLRALTTELVQHIAQVSETRLAGRYPTLGDYAVDQHKGSELRYRTLVLFDFPSGVDEETMRNIQRIAARGPACGVNLIVLVRRDLNVGTEYRPAPDLEWLAQGSLHLESNDHGVWTVQGAERFHVTFDEGAPDWLVQGVCQTVASAAQEAAKPTVQFHRPLQLGGESSLRDLRVVLGNIGTGPEELVLSSDSNNVLVAGKSGSGKSNLLHVMINGLAARYNPDQLQMYLLDFKEGVEFNRYAPTADDPSFLPHVRVVSCESSRDFGIAVLHDLISEIRRRKQLMQQYDVSDIVSLREARPDLDFPRLLVVIDEFQKLLQPDDRVAAQAVQLLETLARQARSFGIHLVLASQTLAGIDALGTKKDAIFGQFPIRIGLQLTSADATRVMSINNLAAAELRYRGQAIINRQLGESADDNHTILVAEAKREVLDELRRQLWEQNPAAPKPYVYRGGRLAQFSNNPVVEQTMLERRPLGSGGGDPALILGQPLSPSIPAAYTDFPLDLPGSHLLVAGEPQGSVGTLGSALVSLAAQMAPGSALFQVAQLHQPGALDGAVQMVRQLGHPVQELDLAGLFDVLREAQTAQAQQPTFVVVHGLHRTPGIDRMSEDCSAPPLDGLQQLVRDGHQRNWHLLAWAPTRQAVRDLLNTDTDRVGVQALIELPRNELERCMDYQLIPASFEPGEQRGLIYNRLQTTQVMPFIPFDPAQWASVPDTDLAVR